MTNPPPGWHDNEPPAGWHNNEPPSEPLRYGATPNYQPPLPGSRSWSARTAALILIPVLVVAAAVGFYVFKRESGSDMAGPVEGQLRGTFPSKPAVGWRLPADQVFSGAQFVLPDGIAYTYMTPGVIDLGDVLLTSAVKPNSDIGATLVGIDAGSGEVLWQNSDVGFKPVCADKTIEGTIPCLGKEAAFGAPTGAKDPQVSFIDVRSGKVVRQLTAPAKASTVMVHGADVYTVGYDEMAKGNAQDLTASWTRTYGTTSTCAGSGDSHYFGVNDNVVFYGSDGGVVVADSRTGEQLTDHELQGVELFGGKGFAGRVCDAKMRASVEIVSADGQVRPVSSDEWVAKPWLVSDPGKVPAIVGDTAYDLGSGQPLWTEQPGPGQASVKITHIVGNTAVGQEPLPDAAHFWNLVGVDLSDGHRLWTSQVSGTPVVSDGERVMVSSDDDELSAVNLSTGEVDWRLHYDRGAVSPAGKGFTITDSDSMTFYGPTGGPSSVPGRRAATEKTPDKGAAGGPVTKCGKTPELKPVQFRAENGAMVVKMEFKATCPGGDILSSNRFRVTIRDGESLIASGYFDFSNNPLVLDGENPTTLDLTFGPGTIWRLPNTLGNSSGSASGKAVTTTADASGRELVDCADEGTSTGPASVDPATTNQTGRATTGTTPDGAPCNDDDALAALRVQTDADRPFVQADLADRWVAQLSAKHPGLVAPDVNGQVLTWTPCEILRQHVRLRLQYPEVRMVWSDEWRTFDLRGWWVTVAGLTFPDADVANRWCDDRAIPVDECFAKVISNSRDSAGTTKYRR
ncbi:putative pyrroloquinoline-quinone binding quinoprotein [Mycobacterium sp. BK086]|uniref:outer membrane protein assembly factor BamB family protein n=1 Tax=Mycobacterium sp. BK086 TaxID=2512165 RepID=UPI001060B4B2|nr:PQQ-binding-like beta-propeller repeat protein [Mycobacterium sp. BK086]TDO15164.1 putative pyrroloquinoline-quinone binding quinoprotein [Mycobacterium sp. BK086]